MGSLSTICKDTIANFAKFSSVVPVNGRPKRSSSSTDVRPSLKQLYIKTFCFGSWHYIRGLPVAFAGFLQQFKIETKFDADSLLLNIGHKSCKKNSPDQ